MFFLNEIFHKTKKGFEGPNFKIKKQSLIQYLK